MKKAGVKTAKQEKQRFTTKELAEHFGVSLNTITNHANKLFGTVSRQGVTRLFTEAAATLILKSLQTPRASGHQLTTSQTVCEVRTGLTDTLRMAELRNTVKQALAEMDAILDRHIKQLQVENAELKIENAALAHDNEHATGVSNWLIKGHQKLGEEVLEKYGGLPYWFNH